MFVKMKNAIFKKNFLLLHALLMQQAKKYVISEVASYGRLNTFYATNDDA